MTFFENFWLTGCFWLVALAMYSIGRFRDELSQGLYIGISIAVIVVGSTLASYLTAGTIAPQSALSNSKVYAVVGLPTKSLTEKDKFIVILKSAEGKEYSYFIKSIPPLGFKAIKGEAGQEFYVPEKFASPKL